MELSKPKPIENKSIYKIVALIVLIMVFALTVAWIFKVLAIPNIFMVLVYLIANSFFALLKPLEKR